MQSSVVGVPYQGDPVSVPPVAIDTSWFPALNYEVIDPAYKLPKSVATTEQWGNMICVLPKWAKRELPYEYCVRMALAGDREMVQYLKWLKATYARVYLEKGPRSPGIDMAGFLGRIKFQVDTAGVEVEGFQRTLAGYGWHFALGFLRQVLGENLMMMKFSVRSGILPLEAMMMARLWSLWALHCELCGGELLDCRFGRFCNQCLCFHMVHRFGSAISNGLVAFC